MTNHDPFGLLILDKPAGPTSHDVVDEVRRGTGASKVGHTGTLDPLATGVLVLCLGSATRLSEYLTKSDKRYAAKVRFGSTTTTYDAAGEVVRETGAAPTLQEVEAALPGFVGQIEQQPPAYSAIKVAGQPAYKLARAGRDPELAARAVHIYEITIDSYEPPVISLSVACSSGTYIRSLAHDLGQAVGSGGYLESLRRTRSGAFGESRALPLSDLRRAMAAGTWREHLINPAEGLPEMKRVRVASEQLVEIRDGLSIEAEGDAEGRALALDDNGGLIAILGAEGDGAHWHPDKVFIR
jgi:tRNA pseudouridine55 synthase